MKSVFGTRFQKVHPLKLATRGKGLPIDHARGQTHVQLVHIIAIRIDLLFPSILLISLQSYNDFEALPNTNTHTCAQGGEGPCA